MGVAIVRCARKEDIAARAFDLLMSQLGAAIGQRGEAHLVLTGGSSAAALFGLLAGDRRAARVDWRHVHVWQGDERFVPAEHADRNWSAARRDWLDLPAGRLIGADHLHPIPVDAALEDGDDAGMAAAAYSATIERFLPRLDGVPAFDVVLLGVGGDGHILSAFPGTAPLGETERAALAVAAPTHIEPHLPRITLTPFLLRAAGMIVVMVPGAGKADVIAQLMDAAEGPPALPAQAALRPNAVWLLEPDSAARLGPSAAPA